MVFFLELLLRLRTIGRYAKDDSPRFLQLFVCVAEPARLNGSTGSIGFRKEEQHHRLAAEIFQGDVLSVLVGQSKVRSFIINIHGSFSLPQLFIS